MRMEQPCPQRDAEWCLALKSGSLVARDPVFPKLLGTREGSFRESFVAEARGSGVATPVGSLFSCTVARAVAMSHVSARAP